MIKAIRTNGNVLLGLSDENLKSLKAGEGIGVDLRSLGVQGLLGVDVKSGPLKLESSSRPGRPEIWLLTLPAHQLDVIACVGHATFCSRMMGAPFDIEILTGTTEQAILQRLEYTGPVTFEGSTQPTSARVH